MANWLRADEPEALLAKANARPWRHDVIAHSMRAVAWERAPAADGAWDHDVASEGHEKNYI